MKIDCVRTHHLRCKLDKPFGFSQWTYAERNALMVEIVADDGAVGWGECYGPAEVVQAAVTSFYAPRLVGRDPLATDVLWHEMWRQSLDFARGGVMTAAVSGLDIALWDLKGAALRKSLSELLGGSYRETIPCYATGMYFDERDQSELIPALVKEAVGYREQGFAAVKIKVGKSPAFDKALIAAMRSALPDYPIMADANHAYDLPDALSVGRALDEHGFGWFEEPLSPEYPEQFAQLGAKLATPLAAGECEQLRYGFQRLLAPGGVQVAQPDLAYCGGISEAVRIRTIASAHGVNLTPHVWGTMLNLAAATHFIASSYHEPGRAEAGCSLLECDRTPNPLRDEMFSLPVQVDRSGAHVPTGPGLGVEVDRGAMARMRVSTTEIKR